MKSVGEKSKLSCIWLIVRRCVGSVNSYSHLMSQTELFGTGSTYLQFLLENKNEIGRNFNFCWLQN